MKALNEEAPTKLTEEQKIEEGLKIIDDYLR